MSPILARLVTLPVSSSLRASIHVALLVVLLAVVASCGYDNTGQTETPTHPTTGVVIDLVTEGMRFIPDRISAPAGETVTIVMDNPDRIKHDFTIDDFSGERVNVEVQPRSEASFTLAVPEQPGEWRFYCSVPGHEALGMEGVLVSE